MVWTPPREVSVTIEKEKVRSHLKKGDNRRQAVRIGLDSVKQSFQVHGVDVHGTVVIRKQLGRSKVLLCTLRSCLGVWSDWKPVAGRITGRESNRSWATPCACWRWQ
jgi:hypothetical protein